MVGYDPEAADLPAEYRAVSGRADPAAHLRGALPADDRPLPGAKRPVRRGADPLGQRDQPRRPVGAPPAGACRSGRRAGAWRAAARAWRRDRAALDRYYRADQRRRERAPERWALLPGRVGAAPLPYSVLRAAPAIPDRVGGLPARREHARRDGAGPAAAPALRA